VQNHAILRNALRKRRDELFSVSNGMQSSETLHNSLGLNYKSAALAAELCRRSHTKAVFSELINWLDLFMARNHEAIKPDDKLSHRVSALRTATASAKFCQSSYGKFWMPP
jgi:hypothetical protein